MMPNGSDTGDTQKEYIMFKPVFALAVAGLTLAACTNPDGSMNRGTNGALIGGLTGVVVGNAVGGSDKDRIIGGVVGAAIGGTIGNQLESQERELREATAGSGLLVTRDGQTLIVALPEAITFATGSVVVQSNLVASIVAVARNLQTHRNSTVLVEGHTDNVGSYAFNQDLSERRALAVAQILINNGTASSRVSAIGRAFSAPVASNSTAAGRAQNRRVAIIITPNS